MSDHPGPDNRLASEESIASYQKLLEHDPTSQVFALVAEHQCAKGLWREAAATCRHGLVFHPRHLKGKILLGLALRELGEAVEAERILTEAHKELSKNAILYDILAGIATNKGESGLAQHYLTLGRLLRHGPESAPAAEPQMSAPEPAAESQPQEPVTAAEPPDAELVAAAEPELQSSEAPVEAEPPERKLIDFLAHLSVKYEQKPVEPSDPSIILTEADRQQLYEMFNFSTG